MKNASVFAGLVLFSLGSILGFGLAVSCPGILWPVMGPHLAILLVPLGASLLIFGWKNTRDGFLAMRDVFSGSPRQTAAPQVSALLASAIRLVYVTGWGAALLGVIVRIGDHRGLDGLTGPVLLSLLPLLSAFLFAELILRRVKHIGNPE